MSEVVDFLQRYLDAEHEAHQLDVRSTSEDPLFKLISKMHGEYFAKPGILPTHEFLWVGSPTPAERKSRRGELQRRPLFKVARYGEGKAALFRAWLGDARKREGPVRYWQTLFLPAAPRPTIIAVYRLGPFLRSSGLLEWDWSSGEKISNAGRGEPDEVVRITAPKEKTSLADFKTDRWTPLFYRRRG